MKKSEISSLAALGILLAAGCQNTVNTVENAEKSATPSTITDHRYITDGFLRERLKLRAVNVTTAPSGNRMVQITATNVRTGVFSQAWSGLTGENPYKVDYRFTWQDENGMELESPLYGWRTMVIQPGETVYFKSVAPTRYCRDFILNLKESK